MTEPRYILLAEGEKIQDGDEFLNKDGKWERYAHALTDRLPSAGYAVRRKLEGWREIKFGSQITFPCVLGCFKDTFVGALWPTGDRYIPDSFSYTHWLPLPPLPVKQSEAEIAWAEYCEKAGKQANDHTFTRAGFIAGFEAGRKK